VFPALVIALGGCVVVATPSAAAPDRSRTTVLALLDQLEVLPEVTTGYDRGLFRHWITTDGCRHCCIDGSPRDGESGGMKRNRRSRPPVQPPSAFIGFRFPPDVILLAVRWYLRYGLSYRDREEILAERGIDVDHVTLFRWVQRFTPELIDAASPRRHAVGDRWFTGETYVKVAGVWRYVYRAVDQHGQVIDILVSQHRDIASARRFFTASLRAHRTPTEIITDRATALANVIDELIPAAFHNTGQYENNRCEADHGRLKARLRPMRGRKTDRTASIVTGGHANVWNLRRGHYELGVDTVPALRLATAFDELR